VIDAAILIVFAGRRQGIEDLLACGMMIAARSAMHWTIPARTSKPEELLCWQKISGAQRSIFAWGC
jgi:hypothetical protein